MTNRVIITEGNTLGNIKGGVNNPNNDEAQNVKPSKPPPGQKQRRSLRPVQNILIGTLSMHLNLDG